MWKQKIRTNKPLNACVQAKSTDLPSNRLGLLNQKPPKSATRSFYATFDRRLLSVFCEGRRVCTMLILSSTVCVFVDSEGFLLGKGRGGGGNHSQSCTGKGKAWWLSYRYTLLPVWERGFGTEVVMAIHIPSLLLESDKVNGVVVIISIHTPSFSWEREEVRVTMARYQILLPTQGDGWLPSLEMEGSVVIYTCLCLLGKRTGGGNHGQISIFSSGSGDGW